MGVSGCVWGIILGEWEWVRHYFGWVGVVGALLLVGVDDWGRGEVSEGRCTV